MSQRQCIARMASGFGNNWVRGARCWVPIAQGLRSLYTVEKSYRVTNLRNTLISPWSVICRKLTVAVTPHLAPSTWYSEEISFYAAVTSLR